jgi:tetratricopeptide (TPR) repeat protein
MARDPAERPATAGQLARGLEQAVRDAPDSTAATQRFVPPTPFQRDERPPPPRRRAPVAAQRQGLPRWIPVAALVAVLLVVAGAIAALSNGGADNPTAPIIPATTPKKHAKKKPAAPPQQTQPQTTPAQTQSQTTPAPASSSDPAAMEAQAHNLISQGKYDEAIALDRQVVAQGPGSGLTYVYALYDLGHALRLAGRSQEAIPILKERMKIDNQRDVVKAELKQARQDAKR